MNIILNILNWFSQNILQNPAFFVGLLVLIGYALLKNQRMMSMLVSSKRQLVICC